MNALPDALSLDLYRPPAEWRRLYLARRCPVCEAPVPEGAGVLNGTLGAVFHRGACADAADAVRRDRGRSRRGRLRGRAEWRWMVDVVRRADRLAAEMAARRGRAPPPPPERSSDPPTPTTT
jgi:hypothetical protein